MGQRRRREGTRVLGAVVALVVLPSLSPDLFGLACPHHAGGHPDAPPAHQAPGPPAGPHTPTPAPAPGHAEHPVTPTSQGQHGSSAPCTCAGSCPVSGSAAAPSAGAAREVEVGPPARAHLPAGTVAALPASPYLLPFPNGPPAA